MAISTITKKVQRLVDRYHKAGKVPTDKREKDAYDTEILTFDSLFNVTTCKCYEFSIDDKHCSCLMKVSLYESEFYVDQKNERKQVIAGVDHQMSVLLQKHNERAQLLDDRMKVTLKKQKI